MPGQPKDHLYLLPHGLIYTSPGLISKSTSRSSACILLTAQRKPFEFAIGKQSFEHTALAVRPLQERSLRAQNRQLISVMVHPTHPQYRRFRAIIDPGYHFVQVHYGLCQETLLRSPEPAARRSRCVCPHCGGTLDS